MLLCLSRQVNFVIYWWFVLNVNRWHDISFKSLISVDMFKVDTTIVLTGSKVNKSMTASASAVGVPYRNTVMFVWDSRFWWCVARGYCSVCRPDISHNCVGLHYYCGRIDRGSVSRWTATIWDVSDILDPTVGGGGLPAYCWSCDSGFYIGPMLGYYPNTNAYWLRRASAYVLPVQCVYTCYSCIVWREAAVVTCSTIWAFMGGQLTM